MLNFADRDTFRKWEIDPTLQRRKNYKTTLILVVINNSFIMEKLRTVFCFKWDFLDFENVDSACLFSFYNLLFYINNFISTF